MINFNILPAERSWPWKKRNPTDNNFIYAEGAFREGLISLTQSHLSESENASAHRSKSDEEKESAIFCHDAMIREPKSGQMLGRVRLNCTTFDKPLVSFQLVKGSLKSAWATESILLICPLNGPARYIKIMAHPPEDCDVGLFRVEQGF